MRYTYFLISFCFFFHNCAPKMSTDGLVTLYVGTYTQKEGHVDGKAQGIYQLKFNSTTGQITVADTITGMVNPSFLALALETGMLYAVNEKSPSSEGLGQLEIYDIHPEQFGTKMRSLSTGSYAPCHVVLDKARKIAVVANYVGGTVAVFNLAAGKDSSPQYIHFDKVPKTSSRQEDSHPHSAIFSADEKYVYVTDLGTDRVMIFKYDQEKVQLVPGTVPFVEMPDGSGPRHTVFSPDGKLLYVLNELSNTVAVMEVVADGALKQQQLIATLSEGYTGNSNAADIHLSKNGKMLYTSNRGSNTITVFKVDEKGNLQSVGQVDTHGTIPRNFHLTNDGKWMMVANQNSGNIALFDLTKGDLPVFVSSTAIGTPVCIVE
jgi:6-phosphogluconolactonase